MSRLMLFAKRTRRTHVCFGPAQGLAGLPAVAAAVRVGADAQRGPGRHRLPAGSGVALALLGPAAALQPTATPSACIAYTTFL